MTRERNNVVVEYCACVERLIFRDDDLRRVISVRNALCFSIGSAVDDVVDIRSTVVDQIGRAGFRALRQL